MQCAVECGKCEEGVKRDDEQKYQQQWYHYYTLLGSQIHAMLHGLHKSALQQKGKAICRSANPPDLARRVIGGRSLRVARPSGAQQRAE